MRSFISSSVLIAGLALGVSADDDSAAPSFDTASVDPAFAADPAALQKSYWKACEDIKAAVTPASGVYYPGDAAYATDIAHFFPWSSQNSTCAVSPATPQELGAALKIIGKRRVPFAIKSGGHAHNPNFSSTPGVHISMDKFNQVTVNTNGKSGKTADIGSGLRWIDVARVLEPQGLSTAYGRCGGVGIGGYNTGGGYSWKSQQVGLAIDIITAMDVVLPNGTFVENVSDKNYKDLFFALKGGLNNFGVVTNFRMKVYEQGPVWHGNINVAQADAMKLVAVGEEFNKKNKDPKAGFYTQHAYSNGNPVNAATLFYDGENLPKDYFAGFLALNATGNTFAKKTYTQATDGVGDAIKGPNNWMADHFGLTKYSASVLKVIIEQTNFWGTDCLKHGCIGHANIVEPYHPNMYKMATDSAWPHGTDHPIYLGRAHFTYNDRKEDAYFANAIKTIISKVHAAALADGQDLKGPAKDLHYSNYAKWDVPADQIYGENLPRLRQIKRKYDPNNVMGLAGGYKII